MPGSRTELLPRRKLSLRGICVTLEERGSVWEKYIEVYEIYNVNFRNFLSLFVSIGKHFLSIKTAISKFLVEGDLNA